MEMLRVGQTRYLENHRVYEMFTNVVKALVMCQPSDPLKFISWYLKGRRHVDVPKIILIAPPHLKTKRAHVALNLAKITGAVTVDRRNVLLRSRRKREDGKRLTDFANALTEYVRVKGASTRGWILLDVPDSKEEADRLISLGVLPTHALVLDDAVSKAEKIFHPVDEPNRRYKNLECELKIAFRSTLKEIRVDGKSIDEVTESCLEQVLRQKPSDAPGFVPRITIVGPEGSSRFATAEAVSRKFNAVHVDFDRMLVRKKIVDDGTAEDIPQEMARFWLKERITENDCVEKGYVLTGFPRTKNDLEWLDSIEMAPNRVIFLAIDFRDLYACLRNRCVNKLTGTAMSLERAAAELKSGALKLEHMARYPLNSAKLFCDFKTYSERLREMLYYCGDGCSIVQTGCDRSPSLVDGVLECVESGCPATRPQNHAPTALTARLEEKMLRSCDYVACRRDSAAVGLTEDAQSLLTALEEDGTATTETTR